jgi:ATP-dependent DNA helicase PIF1
MFQSSLWRRFEEYNFNINLRLSGLSAIETELSPDQLIQYRQEKSYANMIVKIAVAESCEDACITHRDIDRKSLTHVWMPNIRFLTEQDDVIQFLYPEGFNYQSMQTATILCATNDRVDHWNSIIQKLNKTADSIDLFSADEFCEVDDKHKHLKDMISDYVLQAYTKHGVPPHKLTFKIGDICMLMRTLSRRDKLCNNSRVVIKHISIYRIRVQLLQPGTPVYFDIPRIRFIFTLKFGRGFKMMRTQFPLRLAYSMTINKSQGQTTKRTVLDTFDQPFTHGQLYVAMSRVFQSSNMCIYCPREKLLTIDNKEGPVVHNVVINKLIENF